MRHCWSCGADLASAPIKSADPTHVQQLVRLLDADHVRLGTHDVSVLEYFGAVRILAQLFLRISTQRKLGQVLSLPKPLLDLEASQEVRILERLSLNARHCLIPFALDLLGDWPKRFTTIMKKAGVSRADFDPMKNASPGWLTETIQKELAKQNRLVMPDHVRSLIDSWEQQECVPLTKSKARQLLGWQGDLSRYAEFRARTQAYESEARLVSAAALQMLNRASGNRRTYRHCALDLCALLASVLTGQPLTEVVNSSPARIAAALMEMSSRCATITPFADLLDALLPFAKSVQSGREHGLVSYRQVRKRMVLAMQGLEGQLKRSERVFFRLATTL